MFLMATSCVEQNNDHDRRSAGLIQVKGFRWPGGANSRPLDGGAILTNGVAFATPMEICSIACGINLCAAVPVTLLFRQARPIFRLSHPECSVGRLTQCQLSA
jgi:hypothetical protein